jgi:signal transduction histidine kinase
VSLTELRRIAGPLFREGDFEGQLCRIADALAPFVAFIDRGGRLVFHNVASRVWLGEDEANGRTLAEVLGDRGDPSLGPYLEQALLGRQVHAEMWISGRVGGNRYLELFLTPQTSATGLVLGILLLAFDTTERRRREESASLLEEHGRSLGRAPVRASEPERRPAEEETLRQSRDRLLMAVDVAGLGIWDFDFRTSAFTLNEHCQALWNFHPSEGQNWRDLLVRMHPEDREQVEPILSGRVLPGENGFFHLEFRAIGTTDFAERWISVSGRVLRGEDGRPERLAGTTKDITKRKASERALLYTNTLLKSQTEAAIDGILVVDPIGRILSYNHRFVELWGIPAEVIATGSDEEAIRSVLHKLADPEDFIARIRYLYDHPEESSRDELVLKDGRTFDRYSSSVRSAEGVNYGRVWYFRDISERKRQELGLREGAARLEEALRELNSFAYTVAHDLRAPLRAMTGFGQLLKEEYAWKLDSEAKDYIGRIEDAARRMDQLIQDLLDYSRLARERIVFEKVDLGTLVPEVLARFAQEFHDRGARVETVGVLHPVLAHRVVLAQVLSNLISNAVKFVAPGTRPQVRIRSTKAEGGVRLWVEDNGIGIAREYWDRIFGVFQRLHSMAEYPGTGIGLAIVKRAVERMGGRVGVESEPGKGSRFWIELCSPDQALASGK